MLLWKRLALECASLCHTSATRDVKTVTRRFEHEGPQFLAVTLPRFAKDLERALEQGKVTPNLFDGFHRRGELPVLFGGFVEKVFDRETGVLVDKPCIDSIFAVRQLALVFGKMQPPGDSHPGEAAAMQAFVDCEHEVRRSDKSIDVDRLERFRRMSNLLFRDVLQDLENGLYHKEIVPKHGPGKTADRLSGNAKYDQKVWPRRLHEAFPFEDNAMPTHGMWYLRDRVHFVEPGAETPSRVVSVPKTYKTPRIIALEPTCMQFMQQGILHRLVPVMEEDSFLSPFVGFTRQEPNQLLAREGSLHGGLATLDLSEASDRVSYQHVLAMFDRFPLVREAVDATRSRKADVPGHGVIRLAKFASMGSALCFPMEEMVFLTIIFSSIEQSLSTSFTRRDVSRFAGKVRVYGDDIVVPAEHVDCVIDGLESFGLKVNVNKSFWNGKFRESCGKEYYDGTDVTLVRVRQALPSSRKDASAVIAAVELRNQFYSAGFWQTAAFLDDAIERVLPLFPIVEETSSALGRWSVFPFDYYRNAVRMDADHQVLFRPLVRAYTVSSKSPPSGCSGEGALLKYLIKRSDLPIADIRHLERSGQARLSINKPRWTPPY